MKKIIIFLFLLFNLFVNANAADEDLTRITSDGKLVLDYQKKIADFFDNVEVKNANGFLKSDKLKVFFDSEGNNIEKMIAVGNVKIDQKLHQATSGRAEYYSKESKIILTDNPIIKKGDNYYSADVISIDIKRNKVYFEPSAKIVIKKEDKANFL